MELDLLIREVLVLTIYTKVVALSTICNSS